MKAHLFRIRCLTDLHVGSGDINYNIIDNEVSRDAVTGLPVVHASGMKGALRDYFSNRLPASDLNRIFGSMSTAQEVNAGSYKFFDARLIARPMRAAGDPAFACIPVATAASLNGYLSMLSSFGCNHYGSALIQGDLAARFGENEFLSSMPGVRIEGERTGPMDSALLSQLKKLEDVLGQQFALARSFDNYSLPVVARNHLENGRSKNLWYEELVPQGSVFYFLILTPGDMCELTFPEPVQLGANASIGRGFAEISPLPLNREVRP